jgi:hypothetical protein
MIHCLSGRVLCRLLAGKWSSFARSLETDRACAGPSHDIPLMVGNGYHCIVKGGMNVGDPFRNVFPPSLFPRRFLCRVLTRLRRGFFLIRLIFSFRHDLSPKNLAGP